MAGDLEPSQQGIVVLAHVWETMDKKVAEHRTLLERIPLVAVQFAWLILFNANYLLRVVEPQSVQRMLELVMMASGLVLCMSILRRTKTSGVVPICHWCWVGWAHASWANCLPMMFARHPEVAFSTCPTCWRGHPNNPSECSSIVSQSAQRHMGFDPPSQQALCEGATAHVGAWGLPT